MYNTILECYSVNPLDTLPMEGERAEYIPKKKLSDDSPERFFDDSLDEVLIEMATEKVLMIQGKLKDAEASNTRVKVLLQNLKR